jgi:hypothetical protein
VSRCPSPLRESCGAKPTTPPRPRRPSCAKTASDQILGAALLTVDGRELINTVALAMRHGITATGLRDAVYAHPSSTEAFNERPRHDRARPTSPESAPV